MVNKLKRWLSKAFSGSPESGADLYYPGYDYPYGLAHPDDFDSMVQADTSWVYALTNINAKSVAATPLRLYVNKPQGVKLNFEGELVSKQRRKELSSEATTYKYVQDSNKELVEVFEHPVLDLLKNVNPEMNGSELFFLTSKFSDLTGNSYWWMRFNNIGQPEELYVLPSHQTKVSPSRDTLVKKYVYDNGVNTFEIPTEEIIHFKTPSPMSTYYGKGALAGAVEAVNINILLLQYEHALLDNMSRPAMWVDVTGMTRAEVAKFGAAIKKQTRGAKKAGGLVMGPGKVQQMNFSPKDINVLTEGKPVKEQLAAAFGVPMSMLGTEDVPYANARTGRLQYAEQGLSPRLKIIEQKLNEQLAPLYDSRMFFAFDNVIPTDREFELKENDTYIKNQVYTINEVRTALGKDPVAWGDEPATPFAQGPIEESSEEMDKFIELMEHEVKKELKRIDKKVDNVKLDLD